MRKSYNDSGLTAKRSYRLLTAGLTAILMAVLSSCASQAPLDDAYYWPDKKAAAQTAASSESVSSSPAQSNSSESSVPPMEIINRQDTTITIRIKR